MLICKKAVPKWCYETCKLDVERSKGASETEAEVLIFCPVKWWSRRPPRIKRALWTVGFSWLCSRSHVMKPMSDAQEAPWLLCPPLWDCQGLCSCCQSTVLYPQPPSGSHMGNCSSYLQIDFCNVYYPSGRSSGAPSSQPPSSTI